MKNLLGLVNDCDKATCASDDVSRVAAAKSKAAELYDLGLVRVAQEIADKADFKSRMARVAGYVRIKDQNIQKFLDSLAKEYNSVHTAKKKRAIEDLAYNAFDNEIAAFRYAAHQAQRAMSTPAEANWFLTQMALGNSYGSASSTGSIFAPVAVGRSGPRALEARTIHSGSTDPKLVGRYVWTEVPLSQYQGVPPPQVLEKLREEKAKSIFTEYHIASVNAVPDPLLLGIIKGCEDRFYLAQWGDDVSLDDVI